MSVVRRLAPIAALLGFALSVTACTSSGSAATGFSTVTVTTTSVTSRAATVASPSTPTQAAPITVGSISAPVSSTPASSAPTSVLSSNSMPTSMPTSTSKVAVLPPVAKVSASPAFGTESMSPAVPVVVSVAKGKITKFILTNPEGRAVKGTVSKDGSSWTVGEVLGYGRKYTATGSALGTDGKAVAIRGSFTTVEPDTRVRVNVSPGDGVVVGIAAPVIIRFGIEPVDRASVEKNVKITTIPKVEGAWAWIKHDDGLWALDWRPKSYWPAGTKVHVEANTYGVKFADGAYGGDDVATDFTIGRNQVVYADAKSFHIVVKQNGKTVADYPASYGSGDDIGDANRVTRSGIHVVNELLAVHKMSNPAYGYTNVTEYWDVRISDNGEFIHQNQGTVGDQGSVNVSHGCINLSAKNAKAYFKSALYGDPVEVTGTSVQLGAADGDLYDWTISWDKWLKLSAL